MRRFGFLIRKCSLGDSGRERSRLAELAAPFFAILLLSFGVIALGRTVSQAQEMQRVDVSGSYRHTPSGLNFPVAVGAFQRHGVLRPGGDVNNEVANYQAPSTGARILANVHVFPAPEIMNINLSTGKAAPVDDRLRGYRNELCRQQFESGFETLANLSASRAQVREEPTSFTQGGRTHAGFKAYVVVSSPSAFGQSHPPLRSESHLYCFLGGRWNVRYGFTYPASLNMRAQIASFISETMTIPPER